MADPIARTDDVDRTVVSPISKPQTVFRDGVSSPPAGADTQRATVLPRLEWKGDQPTITPSSRERYEEVRKLGQGGMGEVVLIKDHDIERNVALKRLPENCDLGMVLRFAEEVRAVGQLEHPNIVPVHDVGIDDRGRYYFVMKHLQGDTLESIVMKLRAGDPAAHLAYPFQVRLQIFLGVLHAMAYAHQQGYIHRDLKPANVMVGPFGEVTVMDWGLAKRIRAPELPGGGDTSLVSGRPRETTTTSQRAGSALETVAGSVMGTPLFMSPEQARGEHDTLDERSDTYSLTVIFHELIFLEHYLAKVERASIKEIIAAVETTCPGVYSMPTHPSQPLPPAEATWFVMKGLEKDKSKRFQSIAQMEAAVQRIIDGRVEVRCARTFMKRVGVEVIRAVDAHPIVAMVGGTIGLLAVVGSLVNSVLTLLK